jgi:hypothetical protein
MTQTVLRPQTPTDRQEEALIREARQLRRRRWAISSLLIASVCVAAGLVIAIVNAGGSSVHRATGFVAGTPRVGALTTLHVASALAVSNTGEPYIADAPDGQETSSRVNADRVLVRVPDGKFRLIVSNLPYISSLAVAPDGTLYIADAGWVREVGRNGVVRTIAGDGHAPGYDRKTGQLPIAADLPALNAPLGSIRSIAAAYRSSPLQIAIGPGGQLYISNGEQVLRLTGSDELQPVKATMSPSVGLPRGQLTEAAQIAVAPDGTIYASGSMRGWSLWAINATGAARYLMYARQNGGSTVDVQSGPHGNIYAANGDSILLVNRGVPRTVFEFRHHVAGQYFWLTNFTIASNGLIYADEIGGGGFEAHQQLVAVHDHHVTLLWQEKNRDAR